LREPPPEAAWEPEQPCLPSVEEQFVAPVPRHRYSVGIVQLFLKAVMSCAATQRATAAILDLVAPWLPGVEETPCANSGRLWLLRVGLHELTREKEKADDWVWIMDHTIQLGPWKCLVIVGLRLSDWNPDRGPLCHEDLTLLNLTPMEQATGERVHEALLETISVTGVPRQIVSDEGTELKKGMEFLHQTHPEISHVHDIKHKMALLLKKELEHNQRWTTFVTQSNKAKLAMTQTALACLVPPSLKTKARYMNLDTLVDWGQALLRFLDSTPTTPGVNLDRAKLEEKCGWLRDYRGALQEWSELLTVADVVEDYIRQEGYHRAARRALADRLAPVVSTAAAREMSAAVLEFVAHESTAVKSRTERLVGHSEVLESLIGKYKQLQSTHSKGGMTAMLLSFGAIVSKKTEDTVRAALDRVRTRQVREWCCRHLGVTLQSQRKLAFAGNKTGIQTGRSDR
jgi:hypothetical protein